MSPSISYNPGQRFPGAPPIACRQAPTRWNAVVDAELNLWRRITICGGLPYICPGKKYAVPPWTKMPPQGKRYMKIAAADLPPFGSGDTIVPFAKSTDVDSEGRFVAWDGYDFCAETIIFQYDGTNFQDGSGDIIFRIQIDQHFLKDFSAVTTQIGSFQLPYPINRGQSLFQSGNRIACIVNHVNNNQSPPGKVLMMVSGWGWPR